MHVKKEPTRFATPSAPSSWLAGRSYPTLVAIALPIAISLMERHPLGSQLFFPLQDLPWLVLAAGDVHDASSFRAFTVSGRQGVNYARNVWHHPLLVLDAASRFLIVDRKGPGNNLEEVWLGDSAAFTLTP